MIAERGLHARGRGQHRVNDEDGGTVLPARPVDVHVHGIAPQKSPGAPMRPDGNDEWNSSAAAAHRGSLQRSKRVWGPTEPIN